MEHQINIAVLFHDTFNLHGDYGNISALVRIAKLGNVKANVEYIDFSTKDFNPNAFDIIYCGPGELSYMDAVKQWLEPKKADIDKFISDGKVLLVTGTSLSLMGGMTFRTDGSIFTGLSVINCSFKERDYIYGGDIYYKAKYNDIEMEIFGSQIRMIDQIIDIVDNIHPFGNIIYGMGADEEAKTEGIIINNSIFTNTLGPILVLNPWLTREIINVALKNSGSTHIIDNLDMTLEKNSLEAKKRFTLKNNPGCAIDIQTY